MDGETRADDAKAVSVIIPFYNAASTIGAQLEALARQCWSGSWEVICVDNGSTDDTLKIVEKYRNSLPRLRVIEAPTIPTQYHAMNVGARAATGEALLFCDADDEVGEGWLGAMAEALSKHDFVACRTDAKKLNESWLVEGLGSSQANGLQTLRFARHVYHAGAGTMGIKRSLLFDVAGGFDESMWHCGDTMLSIKLQLAGATLHFVPDAVLHVRQRSTLWGVCRQGYGYAKYNTLLYKKSIALGISKVTHPWRNAIREWRNLLGMVRRTRNKATLANCMFGLGWQVGLVMGSIKNRVLYL